MLTEDLIREWDSKGYRLFPENPSKYQEEHLDHLLAHAVRLNGSDIYIKTNDYIRANIYGKFYKLSSRTLDSDEISSFLNKIYGKTAISILNTGTPIDTLYVVNNSSFYGRFRVSIKSGLTRGGRGYIATLRPIPDIPPDLDPEVPMELINTYNYKQGLNLVIGATGSGKSTLIASIIKAKLLNSNVYAHMISYEAPPEFDFSRLPQNNSFIDQVEVPRDLTSFKIAVENALRNSPTDVFIGEMRDAPTITEGLRVCDMGHLVYSTMHVNSVADVLTRAASEFSQEAKAGAIVGMIANFNSIIYQRLLPTIDGKRTPVREYLIFNQAIKNELFSLIDPNLMTLKMREMLWKHGYPFVVHLRQRFLEGKISEQTYIQFKQESGTNKSDIELDAIIKEHKKNGHVMFQNNDL